MSITELLTEEGIELEVSVNSKEEAIDLLVDLHKKAGNISDREQFKRAILKREQSGSTAVGGGIAVPHAKDAAVVKAGLTVITVPRGVDYDSGDGQPAKLIFMIAAPQSGGDVHLEVLSGLMALLMDQSFCSSLINARSKKEFIEIIEKAASKKDAGSADGRIRVLAVTACPTGIAHTYMAAEALENAGERLGISVKAETNGSGGAKNILTDEEIAECDGIIIAADRDVDTARFSGKPVLFARVSDGIRKPEELIREITEGQVQVYRKDAMHGADGRSGHHENRAGAGHTIYKHLMNGVSHMLPFVIGGGIMIALAFLLDDYSVNPANFGMNTPRAAFFKTVGDAAFGFMLPVLAAYIASSIADRPGLAPGFAGGIIAVNGTSFAGLAAGDASGVSGGFLAALLAGFAAGYIVKGLEIITEKLPQSIDGIRPMLIYPLGGILITGAFMCAVNPVTGWINTAVTQWLNGMGNTSKILLGMITAGMMSVDMGGPVNKAAYVFGTASLASGNYDVMAAVMIGGMVPPIAIALSTTFFKRKWSNEDRRNGIVNYIMGLCFISEGAIPYAAADPLRVIPSCVVGSAVAGALSMLFGCTLRAPHGGIFVFPVVGHPFMYLLALAVGSAVGALVLSALKKNIS